jgi:hypothetical protein
MNWHPLTGEPIPSVIPHDFVPTGEGLAYERCGFESCTEPSWSGWHINSESFQVTRVEMIEAAFSILFNRVNRASDWLAATAVVDELLKRRGQFEACMAETERLASLTPSRASTISEFLNGHGVTVENREAEGDELAERIQQALKLS